MTREELLYSLNTLKNEDVFSLILFALYKLQDSPEYATLSELPFVFKHKEDLLSFLEVFGGTTIKVPTINELQAILSALFIYEYVNLEGKDFNAACRLLNKNKLEIHEIKKVYNVVCNVLAKYDFRRD